MPLADNRLKSAGSNKLGHNLEPYDLGWCLNSPQPMSQATGLSLFLNLNFSLRLGASNSICHELSPLMLS